MEVELTSRYRMTIVKKPLQNLLAYYLMCLSQLNLDPLSLGRLGLIRLGLSPSLSPLPLQQALGTDLGMGISEELVRGTATTMSDRSNTIRRIVVAFMLCTAEEKHRTLDRN